MKLPELLQLCIGNYSLGPSYCRQNHEKGCMCIFIRNYLNCNSTDLTLQSNEKDFECCAAHVITNS
jgi:hypothetical protein